MAGDSLTPVACTIAAEDCTVLISSLNALVQSAGFSLKMQLKLLLLPIIILSRPDYCNCLLMGTPNSVTHPLQKIQNFAARFVLLAPRHHHSTPLLEKLHWLPISERVKYKVTCMCFNAINGSGPAYLSELLHVCSPSRTLRSSSDTRRLEIQPHKRKTHNFNTFSCLGPHLLLLGIYYHKILNTAQPCHLLKTNWKPSSFHSISIQYNFIAKCQYTDCSRNVLWCQVHSSHIHSNHKYLITTANKNPGKKSFIDKK